MGMTALAAAAVAGPIIGGIMGQAAASGDRAAAAAAAQKAYDTAMSLGLPPDLSQKLILQQFKSAGTLTPEMEQSISAGISQASQVQEDPALRQSQMGSLNLLQSKAQTGLDATDRAAMNQLHQQVGSDTQGKQQQIMQQMQQQGMGGSGAQLAAMLQNAQAGSNQESTHADQIAGQASQNALSALSQAGQLGSQVRGQDFSNASAKANAADQFKRFDTQNQIDAQARNVAAQNSAQASNLSNTQRISDANTQQNNNEAERANQSKEQYWQDQLSRTTMQANAANGQATNLNKQGDAIAGQYSGIGAGAGQAAGSLYGYMSKTPATPPVPPGGNTAMSTRTSDVYQFDPNKANG